MADALGMTFPIPLPVIMQDEKDYAEGVPDSGTQVVITFHDMNTFLNRNNGIQSSNN